MEKWGARQSSGSLWGGMFLALLIGGLSPYLLAFLPLFLSPVLLMWVFSRFGLLPAIVGIAAALASTGVALGPQAAFWTLLAFYLPCLAALVGVRQKKPFEEQVKRSVAAGILALALASLAVRLMTGEALVERLMQSLEAFLRHLPGEALRPFLLTGASTGLLPNAPSLTGAALTAAERQKLIAELMQALRSMYEQTLPGLLLFGAALMGLLLAAIPNRHLSRRGLVPGECYLPLAKWHLPASMTFGLVAAFVGLLILHSANVRGATAVSFAGEALLSLAFGVQAIASLERRLIAGNMRPGMRVLLISLFAVLLSSDRFLMFYGMLSALAGPHYGAIPQILRSRRDDEDSNS